MNKVKSAVYIAFYALLLAALSFVLFVPFYFGEGNVSKFDPILNWTQKDADLGWGFGADGESYLGGGYVGVYYPEGVISAKDYETNLAGYEDLVKSYEAQVSEAETGTVKKAELQKKLDEVTKVRDDYKNDYKKYGNALYMATGEDGVLDNDGEPTEEFKTNFAATLDKMVARYSKLHHEGVRVEVQNDYAIRVFVPQEMNGSAEQTALVYFGYTGALTVRYGENTEKSQVMPVKTGEAISDYVKGASVVTRRGVSSVCISFTDLGLEKAKSVSSGATSENKETIYFVVGEEAVISLPLEKTIDGSLYITSESYTEEVANIVATLLNSAVSSENDLALSLGDTYSYGANYGNNALLFIYIAFAVLTVGSMIFFFVRYHLLGFVHLLTYWLFVLATVLCVWAIPFLSFSVETFLTFVIASGVLAFTNAVSFEYARKEVEIGKAMSSAVKTGYKKCFWHIFDTYIVFMLLGFVGCGIALASLRSVLFLVGLLSFFAGICTLGVNRLNWAALMSFTGRKKAFCNFKELQTEEEVDEDEQ